MRIVVALGGNALLRRGQPMTAENQRENVKIAAQALAPIATGNQLVIIAQPVDFQVAKFSITATGRDCRGSGQGCR